jgi:hypothetical protein
MADEYKRIIVPREKLPNLVTRQINGINTVVSAAVSTRLEDSTTIPIIRYTTNAAHNLKTGDVVQISGITPEVFNISPTKVIVISPTEFSVDKTIDPLSSYTSGGTVDQVLGNYVVRFRIVSEDRSRISFWSPQYTLSPAPLTVDEYSDLSVVKSGSLLLLNWTVDPTIVTNSYDIFVAWGTQAGSVGLTEYVGSSAGTFFTLPIPVGKVSAQIWVQTTSIPRNRIPDITVASTNGVISVA